MTRRAGQAERPTGKSYFAPAFGAAGAGFIHFGRRIIAAFLPLIIAADCPAFRPAPFS
ncbi:hypothetical protein [Candidatus Tokpelaia sp.]|uniref:hypothetical protein n=1 Tax=Candidatus Tokpelaia sp. TaxID=2233777 RepID=UPI001680C9EF|nr:hypothetical protein [Candidatus Tokpelaia sp.]